MAEWTNYELRDGGDGRIEVRAPYNNSANYAFRDLAPYWKCEFVWGIKVRMCWPELLPGLLEIGRDYYNTEVEPPIMTSKPQLGLTGTVELHYVGGRKLHQSYYIKEKNDYHSGANQDGKYHVIFPHELLRLYMDPLAAHINSTLSDDPYAVLGVQNTATDQELKKAYRMQSRSWHPDLNPGDRNAHQLMININHAWELLGNPDRRKRYDMGQLLASSARRNQGSDHEFSMLFADSDSWIPPRRNGIVTVKYDKWGKFWIVNEILGWEYITNSQGQIMVSAYNWDDGEIVREWIDGE
jgi:hypothetical protein